ncbi:MAG: hypothetical protein ACRDFC_02370 [Ignavibacteria bacterium]
MKKIIIILVSILISFGLQLKADEYNKVLISSDLNLEKFVREVYDLYQTDEVPVKQERFVYKKLSDLLSGSSYTIRITCSDSIAYDKKENKTTIKSREVYYADAKTGYFGIFVIVQKNGDDLLMKSSPEKEITISGVITDITVISYKKGMDFFKCYTSLKDFDDSGTVIQQIILRVQS